MKSDSKSDRVKDVDSYTSDTFFNGQMKVFQNESGYRFSIDAVLLAGYIKPRPNDRVVDMGTGCGIIPLILAFRNPGVQIFGIEIQEGLSNIASKNVAANNMNDRISILQLDIKKLEPALLEGPVDLVVTNPPFRETNSGRLNPVKERAIARHEIKITLSEILKATDRILSDTGKFITIYPSERIVDLLTLMRIAGIEAKYMRMIHSRWDEETKLVLVEGVKGGRPGIKVGPTLVIYNSDGSYTNEVSTMFLP